MIRYRRRYILGIISLVIVDAAYIAIPQFVHVAVDLISSGVFQWRQIIDLSLWMIGVMTVVTAGRFLWRFMQGSSRRIEARRVMERVLYENLLPSVFLRVTPWLKSSSFSPWCLAPQA